jgi:acyl carrier protein
MNNDIEAIYPLSPAQEGVLFHSISSPEMGLYFHQSVWDLDADVDLSALRCAWQRTIDRHPILRTAFLWEGRDRPLQVVRRHVEACWREMDWDQDSGAREMGFDELLKADRDEGFKLKKAPLMRLTVVRGRRRNRLIWSRHHIIIDGWSSALLKIDQVSVTDNFFDLGGHSLAMAQVFGHLRNALRRDIVLTDLFRFPTIRSLAAHLGAEHSDTSSFAQKYESAEVKRQAMRRSRRLKRAGETEARREDFQAV